MITYKLTSTNSFRKILLIVIAIAAFISLASSVKTAAAQEPDATRARLSRPNFYDIRKRFNDMWAGKPVTKGSGYKVFRRWEWFWEQRVNRDGTFPPDNAVQHAWENYTAENPTRAAAGNWTPMGPNTPSNRYFGLGRINCIAFHPTDPNVFWVGTPSGGLWKTIDFGESWAPVGSLDTQPVIGVTDIAIDPKNPNIMYIATGDGDAAGSVESINSTGSGDTKSIGVLKSTDGGQTWQKTALNWAVKDETLISRLIMNPNNSNILFAATSSCIYKTTDGGVNWDYKMWNVNFSDIAFNPGDPNIIYAASRSRLISTGPSEKYRWAQVWRSTNGGETWDSVTAFTNVRRIKLAVTPQLTSLVEAACVSNENGLGGIYRSSNSGASFTETVLALNPDCSNNYLHSYLDPAKREKPCGGQGDYDFCYSINPTILSERWLGGVNTWKSTTNGSLFSLANYWEDQNLPNYEQVHADKHWFAFHPLQPGTFFECNDGGILYTKNGGKTWKDISKGLQIGQIYRIGCSYVEPELVIAGFQDNGSQVDSSGTWMTPVNIGGDGMECLIDWLDPNIRYASYSNGEIKRTTNGKWSDDNIKVISKNIPGSQSGAWVTPYIIHPENPEILYVGYKNIWKTTKRGDTLTWDSVSKLKTEKGDELLRTLVISESNPKVMWAATGKRLFKTSDEWKNYDSISYTLLPVNKYVVTGIAINPTDPQKVFVVFSGYDSTSRVFSTENAGSSWKDISGTKLPKVPVNCIAYEEGTNDALYIGTDLGVFYKDAGMTEWIPFNNNLPNVIISDLEIEYDNGKIRVATFGRGLWESDLYVASGNNKVNVVDIPRNGGDVSGGGTYKTGAKARLIAKSEPGYSFNGWFENDVKVTDSSSFVLEVNSNHNLVGKFKTQTGIDESVKNQIHLFPNPTKGIVEIRLDKEIQGDLQKIIATDMEGKTVYESIQQPKDQFSIDLSHNAQGNYIISFYFKSGKRVCYTLTVKK